MTAVDTGWSLQGEFYWHYYNPVWPCRHLTLTNKMSVLLISDPTTTMVCPSQLDIAIRVKLFCQLSTCFFVGSGFHDNKRRRPNGSRRGSWSRPFFAYVNMWYQNCHTKCFLEHMMLFGSKENSFLNLIMRISGFYRTDYSAEQSKIHFQVPSGYLHKALKRFTGPIFFLAQIVLLSLTQLKTFCSSISSFPFNHFLFFAVF